MKIVKSSGKLMICSECREPCYYLLEIGERPDYESKTAWICFDCVNTALNVVKRQIPKNKRRLPLDDSNIDPLENDSLVCVVGYDGPLY